MSIVNGYDIESLSLSLPLYLSCTHTHTHTHTPTHRQDDDYPQNLSGKQLLEVDLRMNCSHGVANLMNECVTDGKVNSLTRTTL